MEPQPLRGKRIAVTRAEEQAGTIVAQLTALGAQVLVCPTIAIVPPADFAPLDAVIARLTDYDWLLLTSANTVRMLLGRMTALGYAHTALARLHIGTVGSATAATLAEYGLHTDFQPARYVAESILAEMPARPGQRILLPQADLARPNLALGLRQQGVLVDTVVAYRTVPGPGAALLAEHLRTASLDAITFSSSSTVRYLIEGLLSSGLSHSAVQSQLNTLAIVCIGPITATYASEQGLRVAAVAQEYTVDGVVAALVDWFGVTRNPCIVPDE